MPVVGWVPVVMASGPTANRSDKTNEPNARAFELEAQFMPTTYAAYGGYIPYHDSYFSSIAIERGSDAVVSVVLEWLFSDVPFEQRVERYCRATIKLVNIVHLEIDTLRYSAFSDGSLTLDNGLLELRLRESATGQEWLFRFEGMLELSSEEIQELPDDYLRVVVNL